MGFCSAAGGAHTQDAEVPVWHLVLQAGDNDVALHAEEVLRILPAVAITPLASSISSLLGMINVHGTLLPVFSLRLQLGMPQPPVQLSDKLVLLNALHCPAALLVDGVSQLVTLPAHQVHELKEFQINGYPARGVAVLPDGVVLVHSLTRLLSRDESLELDAALASESQGPPP